MIFSNGIEFIKMKAEAVSGNPEYMTLIRIVPKETLSSVGISHYFVSFLWMIFLGPFGSRLVCGFIYSDENIYETEISLADE